MWGDNYEYWISVDFEVLNRSGLRFILFVFFLDLCMLILIIGKIINVLLYGIFFSKEFGIIGKVVEFVIEFVFFL